MGIAFFFYTSLVICAAVVSCSVSLVVWLMTRRRDCLVAAVGFVAYALEISLIFYDEYARVKNDYTTTFDLPLVHPTLTCVLGIVVIGCVWLWTLSRAHARVTPQRVTTFLVPFTVGSFLLVPRDGFASAPQQYLFWLLRDLGVVACLVFAAWRYRYRASEVERIDMDRSRVFFRVACVLAGFVIVEDTFMILILPFVITDTYAMLFWYLGERNISENVLMFACGAQLLRRYGSVLTVYARHPRTEGVDKGEQAVPADDLDSRLMLFADAHGLSQREAEVLRLVIGGADAQSIANELVIALGTVKAHLSRIYHKVGVSSREELVKLFWRQ